MKYYFHVKLYASMVCVFLIFNNCKGQSPLITAHSDFNNDHIFPAKNIELSIPINGDTVSGYLMTAMDSTYKETVILIRGYPGHDSNFDLAQALRRTGRNVLLFHHRGAWGSQGTFLYSHCLEDVEAVVNFLITEENAAKYRIDKKRLTLIGRSFGGGIALIAGSKLNSIQKIVAISSANYGYIMEFKTSLDQLSSFKKYMQKQLMIQTDIDSFLQELLDRKSDYDIISHARPIADKKVLLIEDSDKNLEWINKLNGHQLIQIETDHGFIDRRIEMIDTIISWLDET